MPKLKLFILSIKDHKFYFYLYYLWTLFTFMYFAREC